MIVTQYFGRRYIPAQKKSERERLMVVLHGLGDSLRGFSFLPEALAINEFSYLLINAPDSYYGGYSWYDFGGDPVPGILRSRELLFQLLGELKQQGVASRDIFVFGFSQGCLMAVDVGIRCPDILGGICAVSGHVASIEDYPEQFSPVAKQQQFLITHGYNDPMVPFEPAALQFQRLQKMGIDLEFKAYDKVHTILPEELNDIAKWFRGRM